jgi:O-succinylbenzoate synthase
MRIERVEVFQVRLPFKEPFRTSFGDTLHQESIVVRLESAGAVGWGEADPLWLPIYSSEMAAGVFLVLQKALLPAVIGKDFASPEALLAALDFVRGNQFAKSAVETAFWDLLAKAQGAPLSALLGGTRRAVAAGVSIGIQETPRRLLDEIARFLAHGYQRIKIKIKPGWDVDIVRQVRQAFPDISLMVDANSAYTLNDVAHLKRLDEFNLLMIEQPLGYDDIVDHAKVQAQLATPICLDESIHSPADARRAIELRAGKIINVKVGRVGGLTNARAIHDLCQAAGWPVWAGGMMDMGIGQAHKIEYASLPNVSLPGDIEPSDRFYAEDIVEPPVTLKPDGTFDVSAGPGIGRQVKEAFIRANAMARIELRA